MLAFELFSPPLVFVGARKTHITIHQLLVITERPLEQQMEVHEEWHRALSSVTVPECYLSPGLVLDSNFDPETTLKSACKIQTVLCD